MEIAKTICLAGHGKLPQGMAAKGPFEHMAVVVEVDEKYGVVLNAECTLITGIARNVIEDILKGYSLKDGVEEIIAEVKRVYHGAARNAIIASIKDLSREYQNYLEGK